MLVMNHQIVETDEFLTRYKGHKPPDFLMAHPYLKDIQQLYPNFKAFLDVAKKHGMDNINLAFPEGMHFYPHDIPEWNCDFMSAQSWALRSPLSYDLGWIERLSAAYYARCWLVYLTEF